MDSTTLHYAEVPPCLKSCLSPCTAPYTSRSSPTQNWQPYVAVVNSWVLKKKVWKQTNFPALSNLHTMAGISHRITRPCSVEYRCPQEKRVFPILFLPPRVIQSLKTQWLINWTAILLTTYFKCFKNNTQLQSTPPPFFWYVCQLLAYLQCILLASLIGVLCKWPYRKLHLPDSLFPEVYFYKIA